MKKIIFAVAGLSLLGAAFAQDFEGGSYAEAAEPAVVISGETGAEARAWIGVNGDTKGYEGINDVSKTAVDAGAYANLEMKYDGDYTGADIKLKFNAETLGDYNEDIIDEAYATGSFKDGTVQLYAGKMKEVWGKGDKVHVLDNFNANDYTDFIFPDYIDRRIGEVMFKASANLSWDYNIKLEGIFTPWMTADRFAAEGSPLYPAAQGTLTAIVKNILKEQGAAVASGAVDFGSGTVDGGSLVQAIMDLSEFSTDKLYADNIRSLKYGQAGVRLTGSLGGIDWGASYYYGHYKQPSANVQNYAIWSNTDAIKVGAWQKYEAAAAGQLAAALTAAGAGAAIAGMSNSEIIAAAQAGTFGTDIQTAAAGIYDENTVKAAVGAELAANGYTVANALPSLNYDQLQVFGLEAAFVLWKLNTRWEFAYNLTEDTAGDNPWIKNNSIAWVAGFDIDLPIHNLNINIQENGSYVLKNDKIEDGKVVAGTLMGNPIEVPIGTADVDYKSDGKYINNKIIVLLSDKWLNEKLTTEVQGIYGIERKEIMIAPKIEYNVSEGLTFAVRGVWLYSDNEDGEFYNFTAGSENHDKAFVQLTAKYQF